MSKGTLQALQRQHPDLSTNGEIALPHICYKESQLQSQIRDWYAFVNHSAAEEARMQLRGMAHRTSREVIGFADSLQMVLLN
jgi:hypothetical protein